MTGRTYRYFDGEVLYPFGYGLSYTRFEYTDLALNFDRMEGPETLEVSCRVRNVGKVTGDEVVQVYVRDEAASVPVPQHSLAAFTRVRLAAGAETQVLLQVGPRAFGCVNDEAEWVIEPGSFTVFVGGGQPGTPGVLETKVEMVGQDRRTGIDRCLPASYLLVRIERFVDGINVVILELAAGLLAGPGCGGPDVGLPLGWQPGGWFGLVRGGCGLPCFSLGRGLNCLPIPR